MFPFLDPHQGAEPPILRATLQIRGIYLCNVGSCCTKNLDVCYLVQHVSEDDWTPTIRGYNVASALHPRRSLNSSRDVKAFSLKKHPVYMRNSCFLVACTSILAWFIPTYRVLPGKQFSHTALVPTNQPSFVYYHAAMAPKITVVLSMLISPRDRMLYNYLS